MQSYLSSTITGSHRINIAKSVHIRVFFFFCFFFVFVFFFRPFQHSSVQFFLQVQSLNLIESI